MRTREDAALRRGGTPGLVALADCRQAGHFVVGRFAGRGHHDALHVVELHVLGNGLTQGGLVTGGSEAAQSVAAHGVENRRPLFLPEHDAQPARIKVLQRRPPETDLPRRVGEFQRRGSRFRGRDQRQPHRPPRQAPIGDRVGEGTTATSAAIRFVRIAYADFPSFFAVSFRHFRSRSNRSSISGVVRRPFQSSFAVGVRAAPAGGIRQEMQSSRCGSSPWTKKCSRTERISRDFVNSTRGASSNAEEPGS